MKIKAYSPKGLVVIGATEEQARAIASQLGANVCTQYNPKLGGWVFSRKREDQIKAIVQAMKQSATPKDDLPGEWFPLVVGNNGNRADPKPA